MMQVAFVVAGGVRLVVSDYWMNSHLTMESERVTSYASSKVNVVDHVRDLLMLVGLSIQLPNRVVRAKKDGVTM